MFSSTLCICRKCLTLWIQNICKSATIFECRSPGTSCWRTDVRCLIFEFTTTHFMDSSKVIIDFPHTSIPERTVVEIIIFSDNSCRVIVSLFATKLCRRCVTRKNWTTMNKWITECTTREIFRSRRTLIWITSTGDFTECATAESKATGSLGRTRWTRQKRIKLRWPWTSLQPRSTLLSCCHSNLTRWSLWRLWRTSCESTIPNEMVITS